MPALRFDPTASVEFDLDRGQIALRDGAERLLVPADALVALYESAAPEAKKDFARRLGTETGRRAAERLGDAASAGVDAVVEHVGGDWALLGLGSLSLERWGKALVFVVSGSPLGGAGDALLGAILEGVLQRAFGREAGAVRLVRDGTQVRFLITSRAGAHRVHGWIESGTPWGEALTRLNSGVGS
ncbi:MAG TPA: hypothetical protein VER33_27190 [Polyangiaceae bacterium]|nr:hypothetical protein [Polyangiaceae bacterium]